MIEHSHWQKKHVLKGIEEVTKNSSFRENSRNLDAFEFGCYRGDCTQLIDNTFYAFQFPIRKVYGIDSFEGLCEEDPTVERFYLFNKGMFSDITHLYPLRPNGQYIKSWFKDLSKKDIKKYDMKPACFIHQDGDLYISCLDAMNFMFSNNLILEGTIIAFDEFLSTSTLMAGGESKAWKEISDKYLVESTEFYRNIYHDQLECWQNSIRVESIGKKSHCKLLDGNL